MLKTLFTSFLFLLGLVAVLPAADGIAKDSRPYVIYMQFVQETTVELSDGSQWAMDAGDCFPVYMFKDQQTKVVLQLGSATFTTEVARMKRVKDTDAPQALLAYRKNLESYLKSKSEAWKKEAK